MGRSGLKLKLEYSDYVHIPLDGKRYELIDGDLHVTPAPRPPSPTGLKSEDSARCLTPRLMGF